MAHRTVLVVDRNVRGIGFGACAGSSNTIMTRRAVIHDAGMIEHGRRKGSAGHVSDTATPGCYHVGRIDLGIFTGGGNAMAGIAPSGQHCRVAVVDKRVGKCGRVVAKSTICGACRVRRRRRLRSGPERNKAAIVAGDTIIGNIDVSQHRGWREAIDIVANVTILCRRHVIEILD